MTLNRINGKWMLVLGLLALGAHGIWGEDLNTSPFQPPDPNYVPDDSAKHISVWDTNEFHLHLIENVLEKVPDRGDLLIVYGGILPEEGHVGQHRFRVSCGDPLTWTFYFENIGVFRMNLSIYQKDTLGKFRIGDRTLFLNVSCVCGFDAVTEEVLDNPHDGLGGMSVREFVKLIEAPVKVKAPRKLGAAAPNPVPVPASSPAKSRRR